MVLSFSCLTAVLLEIQKQIQGRNLIFRVLISTLPRPLNLLWISIMHNANPYPGYGLIWVCGWQSISIPWICRSPWPTFTSHHHTCSPVPLRDKHGQGQKGQSNSCRWALPRDPQCPPPPLLWWAVILLAKNRPAALGHGTGSLTHSDGTCPPPPPPPPPPHVGKGGRM